MPIQIGQKPGHDFTEPIGLLSDCHRRIERFLEVLARVAADAGGRPLNEEQTTALSTALKYFREAAPKHTADEELSLFPRMRESGDPEVLAALSDLDRLEADHFRAVELHRELDALGEAWLGGGGLPVESAGRFEALVNELRGLYRTHIAIEDSHVFPLADRALDVQTRREIGREMAARRS